MVLTLPDPAPTLAHEVAADIGAIGVGNPLTAVLLAFQHRQTIVMWPQPALEKCVATQEQVVCGDRGRERVGPVALNVVIVGPEHRAGVWRQAVEPPQGVLGHEAVTGRVEAALALELDELLEQAQVLEHPRAPVGDAGVSCADQHIC